MIIRIVPANDGKHKWIAQFSNGRTTKFGAVGYTDWTEGATIQQRTLYRARHLKDLKTKDPYRAGYLSYYILWGASKSVPVNVAQYNKLFFTV